MISKHKFTRISLSKKEVLQSFKSMKYKFLKYAFGKLFDPNCNFYHIKKNHTYLRSIYFKIRVLLLCKTIVYDISTVDSKIIAGFIYCDRRSFVSTLQQVLFIATFGRLFICNTKILRFISEF